MKSEVSVLSTVVAAKEQTSCDLDGESVVLDMSSGKYYGLNSVGSEVWNLIQQPKTVRDLRDALVAEFEVDPQRCEEDLLAWLESMSDKGLVKVEGGTEEDGARS